MPKHCTAKQHKTYALNGDVCFVLRVYGGWFVGDVIATRSWSKKNRLMSLSRSCVLIYCVSVVICELLQKRTPTAFLQ